MLTINSTTTRTITKNSHHYDYHRHYDYDYNYHYYCRDDDYQDCFCYHHDIHPKKNLVHVAARVLGDIEYHWSPLRVVNTRLNLAGI